MNGMRLSILRSDSIDYEQKTSIQLLGPPFLFATPMFVLYTTKCPHVPLKYKLVLQTLKQIICTLGSLK